MIALSALLNRRLAELGEPRASLAKAMHCTNKVVSYWCRGKSLPAQGRVPKLAEFLALDEQSILDAIAEDKAAQIKGGGVKLVVPVSGDYQDRFNRAFPSRRAS